MTDSHDDTRRDRPLTQSDLDQFTGTDNWYRHWSGLLYTDGVKFLAEKAGAGAYWLIDLIASYQPDPRVRGNKRLQEFQLWWLTCANSEGLVQLKEDSNNKVVLEQFIPFSDFPLASLKLYVEPGEQGPVLLLPSEH